ncbi:MAG TPA: Na+/H+ antiporter NhaA [Thermomicrobiales bacterium]|nr:Na+/H+ antiporter NhaA [Thermomicrobiales bacterium]
MTRGNEHERGSPSEKEVSDGGEEIPAIRNNWVPDTPASVDSNGSAEITLSLFIRVRPGREEDFEGYLQGFSESASKFPGYIDARVYRPTRGDNRYRILLRFDSEENLRHWTESEERQLWYERGEEFAEAPPWSTNITGTAQASPLALARTPLNQFVQSNVSSIGLLLLGTVLALIFANSPWSDSYSDFWNTYLTIGVERFSITETLRHWVNDGLMALFFFIVGLEIKREVLVGELRYPRQAALPIAAALGGAVGPALVYSMIVLGGAGAIGWGIPIGTDTAFSIGIISALGARVRPQLLVFLTAFAIIDDIVAVGVIAVFYTDSISWNAVIAASGVLLLLIICNRAGIYRWPVYAALGFVLWLAVFESGIHGTLAGVLVAMVVPARSWINPSEFLARGRRILNDFEHASYSTLNMLSNEPQQHATQSLARLTEQVEAPLTHFLHRLHPTVSYGVVPLFAFANAGIPLVDGLGDAARNPVAWGVIAGLMIGKPLGITLFAWLAVRSGIAVLHSAIEWKHVFGVAWLGGIGFTMSLFISELAFGADPLADVSRIGILFGSVAAGAIGFFLLRAWLPQPDKDTI